MPPPVPITKKRHEIEAGANYYDLRESGSMTLPSKLDFPDRQSMRRKLRTKTRWTFAVTSSFMTGPIGDGIVTRSGSKLNFSHSRSFGLEPAENGSQVALSIGKWNTNLTELITTRDKDDKYERRSPGPASARGVGGWLGASPAHPSLKTINEKGKGKRFRDDDDDLPRADLLSPLRWGRSWTGNVCMLLLHPIRLPPTCQGHV
ncbi:hypothetical protein F5I97DRAFT_1828277 [Phlebopus sp. FC_14]|nr:hypothetical protein F5I97DRAFT_1828277 [Phlebopus sp. FC_14]